MSKQKHYQAIRAFADGWKIESADPVNSWEQITNPRFYDDEYHQYRIVPDEDGWIPFYTQQDSECPVDPQQRVEVQYAGELWVFAGKASEVVWVDDGFHNVTRYRPYKIVDEYAELKAAYERGEVIQILFDDGWMDAKGKPNWAFPAEEYRIKPYVNPFKDLKEAHKRGEVIQVNHIAHGWVDIKGDIPWLLPADNYRIKPKVNLIKFTEEKIQLLIECRNSIESVIDGFSSNHASESTVHAYKERCKERLLFTLLMESDKLYTEQKFYGCRKSYLGQEKIDAKSPQ